jgi:hypothetical protein
MNVMDRKIAFFVDGGYFISRLRFFHRHYFKDTELTADHAIEILYKMVNKHRSKEQLNRLPVVRCVGNHSFSEACMVEK